VKDALTQENRTISLERYRRAVESKGDSLETSLFTFSKSEREEIFGKLNSIIMKNDLDILILIDPDNFTYATGVDLPYAEQYPYKMVMVIINRDEKLHAVICGPDWVDLVRDQGWEGLVLPYTFEKNGSYKTIIERLNEYSEKYLPSNARIGMDDELWPQKFYETIQTLNKYQLVPVTKFLKHARMIKTEAELRLLEEASRHSDRAIISALNHTEGNVHDPLGYDLWEFTERIRVHVGEFGGSGTGNIVTLQGDELDLLYKAPEGIFEKGNLIRAEVTNHHRGYWSSSGRIFVVGHPSHEHVKIYEEYISLKNSALEWLIAGRKCSEVFDRIDDLSAQDGITLFKEAGFGHGVGLSEREGPFLSHDDDTVLQPGMVIVLAIYLITAYGELICSKDTYVITDHSPRLLSWYKNWDQLYALVGNSARHG
jgi:Xaa-Pro aminopeptidase